MDIEEEESEEGRKPRTLRAPGMPTQEEVDVHSVTHLPYRSWCHACMAGRARSRPHRKGAGQ